ncbi:MAG: hypothetical protein ABII89_01960 [Candidatus Omnitrophota bacterium]
MDNKINKNWLGVAAILVIILIVAIAFKTVQKSSEKVKTEENMNSILDDQQSAVPNQTVESPKSAILSDKDIAKLHQELSVLPTTLSDKELDQIIKNISNVFPTDALDKTRQFMSVISEHPSVRNIYEKAKREKRNLNQEEGTEVYARTKSPDAVTLINAALPEAPDETFITSPKSDSNETPGTSGASAVNP